MKETLRSLSKKVSRPAVPFAVGMMALVGTFVDIGITDSNASNYANKVYPPKASQENLENARSEIRNFDQLIIDQAHSGTTSINVSQIPRRSETMQALDLKNQETEISQKRNELKTSLTNKSVKRQLGFFVGGLGLMVLGASWDGFQKFRSNRNKNVSVEPIKS